MEIVEKISVKLATWYALKLFFRPLDFPTPEREKPIRDKAKIHHLSTGKSDFIGYEWGTKGGPRVLLVHGWSGRGTQFFKIIEALLNKGFHVFALDAPAHGESKQKKTHMLEFVDSVEVMEEKFGPMDYALGHSLGGMAIFNAMKRNLCVRKIVLIGTPDNIRHVVQDFCEKVHASTKVAEGIITNIENRYSMKIENASTDELANKFNPQGLIIHDKNDQDISVLNAENLATFWPNADLVITEGLGHRRVLMDQNVIDSILGFLPLD